MIPVLLLSDEISEIKVVSEICKKNNLMFIFVSDLIQFKNILIKEKIVVAILNSRLLNSPIETIDDLRSRGCNTSFIYIGDKEFDRARALLRSGFYDYLPIGYLESELEESIMGAIDNVYTFEKIKGLSEDLEKTNKSLLRKTEELEKEKKNLNEHIRTLKTIQKFVKEISLRRNLDEIVDITLKYLSEKFHDRIIVLTLIDDFKETVFGTYNIKYDTLKNLTFDLKDLKDAPWANTLLEQKVPVYVENPLEDDWYRDSKVTPYFPYGFAKFPLISRNKVSGTITISLKTGDRSEIAQHESYIFFISEHTAIAIDNLKLHEELLKSIENLKKTQQQLIEHEKVSTLAKLAVSVNHEINNPLCSISLNVELLKRNFLKDNNEQLKKIFEALEKNIEKISEITNKINNMKKIVTKEYLPGIEMIDLENN